jgi:hypothetical protein
VLALAGMNALTASGCALIYWAAGSRRLAHGAFLVSLVVFFVAMTALWVRLERSVSGGRDGLSRLGRGAVALVMVVVGLPAVVLAPLFALQEAVPADAGLTDLTGPAMVLLLIALAFMVAVNVAGLGVLAVSALGAGVTSRR